MNKHSHPAASQLRRTLADRFWAKVDRREPSECWLWQGCKKERGYGRVCLNGRRVPAARVAWELHNGQPFPAGKLALHTCDNPPCVNPNHIFVGTDADNMRDMAAKGRGRPLNRIGGRFAS